MRGFEDNVGGLDPSERLWGLVSLDDPLPDAGFEVSDAVVG